MTYARQGGESPEELLAESIRLRLENEQLRAQLVAMDKALEDASPEVARLRAELDSLRKSYRALVEEFDELARQYGDERRAFMPPDVGRTQYRNWGDYVRIVPDPRAIARIDARRAMSPRSTSRLTADETRRLERDRARFPDTEGPPCPGCDSVWQHASDCPRRPAQPGDVYPEPLHVRCNGCGAAPGFVCASDCPTRRTSRWRLPRRGW